MYLPTKSLRTYLDTFMATSSSRTQFTLHSELERSVQKSGWQSFAA